MAAPNSYGAWWPPRLYHRWRHLNPWLWRKWRPMDHDHILIAVLEGFEQCHVKLNVNKVKFLIWKATFMSHVTTMDGLQPNLVTIKAIIAMPVANESQAVHQFLGAINHLAKFCYQLSSVTQLQCNLSKKDMPYLWSTRHQQTFDSAKFLATSAACLAYFDVTSSGHLRLWPRSCPLTTHQTRQ